MITGRQLSNPYGKIDGSDKYPRKIIQVFTGKRFRVSGMKKDGDYSPKKRSLLNF